VKSVRAADDNVALSPPVAYDKQDIEDAADFASQATGVRKEFLIGMLTTESGMGKNTGQCTYGQVEDDANSAHRKGRLSTRAWKNFLQRRDIIKDIADDLHYDYESLKVSCTPSNYAGTGGAMGVSQFMPDTWLEYKDRVSAMVGKENPDPWNTRDAVVAMAIKLMDVPGVADHWLFAERSAAKMYLSGNTSGQYEWYANEVMYWANNYGKVAA